MIQATATGARALVLGVVLGAGATPLISGAAHATAHHKSHHAKGGSEASGHAAGLYYVTYSSGRFSHGGYRHNALYSYRSGPHYYARSGGGISCVPFARNETGIELVGNAWSWWSNAEGVYARGNRPEPGSILAFRATGHMRLGHVAAVNEIVNSREILIDHANWSSRGAVARDIPVIDISPNNDWTLVRVALGDGYEFGSAYPTYGFIYDRPEVSGQPTAALPANQARLQVTTAAERRTLNEVAEVPIRTRGGRGLDLTIGGAANFR